MIIYNSLTRKQEEFKPIEKNKVSMYLCGPTVYDHGHLGHGRSAVAFDIIRKYFEYQKYEVNFVSNYTDIDDKMINRAQTEKITVKELANKVIPEYEKDYRDLGIKKPTFQPKATEHIKDIIKIIEKLEEKNYIYTLEDGVYYDIAKFKKYGDLSGQKLEELKMGARIKINNQKKNPYDFVVWKFKKKGEPSWNSPWGEGRPGWHIECSAMTWSILGKQFDIHGGGLDLKFPHHSCEIAQSQGAFGKESFAKYWMHNGFIQIDNKKMSKSLNNFFTLKDIFKKYKPQVVRLMFLQTHYRNPINFSDKLLDQSKASLERLHDFIKRIESEKLKSNSTSEENKSLIKKFEASMNEDLDTSGALGVIFDFIRDTNKALDKKQEINTKEVLETFKKFDKVLGIIFPVKKDQLTKKEKTIFNDRVKARQEKNWQESDKLREELKKTGIEVEDKPKETTWKRV